MPAWLNWWIQPVVIFALLGAVAVIARPLLARYLRALAKSEPATFIGIQEDLAKNNPEAALNTLMVSVKTRPDLFAEMMFAGLKADDADTRLRRRIEVIFSDRIRDVDESMQTSKANAESLNAIYAAQQAQGVELRDISKSMRELPQLSEQLDRLNGTLEDVGEHIKTSNKFQGEVSSWMAMMNERERGRLAEEERRHKQDQEQNQHRRLQDINKPG